ncbi:MAG: hypothetical protein QM758_30300 [Armatimonas sp.]
MSAKDLPPWVLPGIIVLGVLALGLIAYFSLSGRSDAPVTRDIEVRPGMYDIRAELQKPRPQPK